MKSGQGEGEEFFNDVPLYSESSSESGMTLPGFLMFEATGDYDRGKAMQRSRDIYCHGLALSQRAHTEGDEGRKNILCVLCTIWQCKSSAATRRGGKPRQRTVEPAGKHE